MPNLDYVQWDITSACNLKCRHCREKATVSSLKDDLSLEEGKSLIDQIVTYHTRTLSIAGGEPLMSPLIWDMLAYASGKFERLVISSNGTIITDDIAKKLGAHVTVCQVSLDGSTVQTHDLMRGRGTFEKSLAGIRCLQNAGVEVAVRLTLYRGNMHDVRGYVDLAARLGLSAAYLRRVIPSGNAKKYGLEVLSPEELRDTIGDAIEYGRSIGIHVASADYFCQIAFRDDSRKKAIEIQKLDGKHIGGCAIGMNSFYVMQNGIVAYCPYLPVFCGDLRKQTLDEIWRDSQMFRVARSCVRTLRANVLSVSTSLPVEVVGHMPMQLPAIFLPRTSAAGFEVQVVY